MSESVIDNPAQNRFELPLGEQVAFIDYRRQGAVRVLLHAEVPVALRGGGIAARLTAGALDLVRAQGERVVPRCPYIAHYIERHPQYQDLVAG